MRFENVTFYESEVRKMSRNGFMEKHQDVLWLDRKPAIRRKMLGEAYDLMVPKESAKSE